MTILASLSPVKNAQRAVTNLHRQLQLRVRRRCDQAYKIEVVSANAHSLTEPILVYRIDGLAKVASQ